MMVDPELAQLFQQYADEWERFCADHGYHSITRPYLEHPSCAMIVALGIPIVPLIMERYRTPKAPWEYVLQEITGQRVFNDVEGYDPAAVQKNWFDWWQQRGQWQYQ